MEYSDQDILFLLQNEETLHFQEFEKNLEQNPDLRERVEQLMEQLENQNLEQIDTFEQTSPSFAEKLSLLSPQESDFSSGSASFPQKELLVREMKQYSQSLQKIRANNTSNQIPLAPKASPSSWNIFLIGMVLTILFLFAGSLFFILRSTRLEIRVMVTNQNVLNEKVEKLNQKLQRSTFTKHHIQKTFKNNRSLDFGLQMKKLYYKNPQNPNKLMLVDKKKSKDVELQFDFQNPAFMKSIDGIVLNALTEQQISISGNFDTKKIEIENVKNIDSEVFVGEFVAHKEFLDIQFRVGKIAPVGSFMVFFGNEKEIPEGWLVCDGRAVSRTKYSRLFNVLKTFPKKNPAKEKEIFHLPDFQSKQMQFFKWSDKKAQKEKKKNKEKRKFKKPEVKLVVKY